ncbi:MAG: endonuclease/exonuclease/phosphatase family protein [Chlamydiota bacterium]
MKFLTLNIYKGLCLEKVISFIEEGQFDVIHMQEVTGGAEGFTDIDCFTEIKKRTGMQGELAVSWNRAGDKSAYLGNATFFSPSIILEERVDLRFTPLEELEDSKKTAASRHPRNALFLRFKKDSDFFWSVNTHMAWGPTPFDEPYKIEAAKILARNMEQLKEPFLLAGDFNVVTDTEVIGLIEPLARNLIREKGVINTLNPRLHRVPELFPPGLAVDYIFIHPSISINNFKVLDQVDLSDHQGLMVDFQLMKP